MDTQPTVFNKEVTLNNGYKMPQIGYGCYKVKENGLFYKAIQHGYRHLDTAKYYENEKQVGDEVKQAMKDFGLKRSDLFITSKIWDTEQGYEKSKESLENSLRFLDLDYIDLMLIHSPGTEGVL